MDFGIPVFFHAKDFKIKIRPAVYVPLFYTVPNITYSNRLSYNNGNEGIFIGINYKVDVYSLVSMENMDINTMLNNLNDNKWDILRGNLGYDLGFGIEYPLFSWLDIGTDIYNLPFYKARLNHNLKLHQEIYIDTSYIDIEEIIEKLENGE